MYQTGDIVSLRPASAEDVKFLRQMLLIAADWRATSEPRTVEEMLSDPTLARYVADWPREGEFGSIAEEMDVPVGAAWCRFCSDDDPGYGFVGRSVPELSIGVVQRVRGRGVGRQLLMEVVRQARRRSLERVSLSVEPDNPAMHLYESVGFETVGRKGAAVTMVLRMPR